MASESFLFDLTPDQQSLVDDFMTNTYPNWKTALQTTAQNVAGAAKSAAGDWGKQKAMIGGAQTPVSFTAGGGNLATWVPYRTSMGNAIDKEAAYKTAGANAELQPTQTLAEFYSNTVAPMEKARLTSQGQLGYVEMYNPKTKNSGTFPVSMVPDLEAGGWQLGSPDKVNATSQYWDKMLERSDPGLAGELTNMISLIRMGTKTWKDLEDSGLVDWVRNQLGDDADEYFDNLDIDVSGVETDFSDWSGDDWYA